MKILLYLVCALPALLCAAPADAAAPAPKPAASKVVSVTPAPQAVAGKAVSIGDFAVIPLLDGDHRFPLSIFNGADEAELLQTAGTQPVPGSFNVFLIKRGKERFLVDSGNGNLNPDRSGQLPLALKKANTAPAEISRIFITHLHGDHIGGLLADDKPVFPKAKVYVARAEYDYWMSDESVRQAPENRRGYFRLIRDQVRVLDQYKQLVFFAAGAALTPGITAIALPGHTPGHTGFLLSSRGKKIFFIGDLVHAALLQLPRPDITLDFDVDQPRARETRLRAFKQIAAAKTPVAAAHLPFPGVGLLRPEGRGYKLEAVK